MVSMGVGGMLNLVFVDELGAKLWQHRILLEAQEPHCGPSRVIMGPSQS
jgi:hypothetical protein